MSTQAPHPRTATRTHGFTESVIREMTRVAAMHEAINLAQGFPDFPAPDALKAAACDAIRRDVNQYAVTWGSPRIRRALQETYAHWYGWEVDPDREVTVTCGATEAMASALLAVVDPGDEVVVFEPFYENYGPDAILCGAKPVWVPMERTHDAGGLRFVLDLDRLRSSFGPTTRAVVLNTPNNPSGHVFSREELEAVAALCREHGVQRGHALRCSGAADAHGEDHLRPHRRRARRSAAPTCRPCCCGRATPSTSGTRGSPTARY